MAVATVSLDYAYLGSEDKETAGEVNRPIVAYHDRKTGASDVARSNTREHTTDTGQEACQENRRNAVLGAKDDHQRRSDAGSKLDASRCRDAQGPGAETTLLHRPVGKPPANSDHFGV